MRRRPPEDLTPWSLVAPVALAVMIGILAADLVRLGVGALMVKSAIDAVERDMPKSSAPTQRPADAAATRAQPAAIQYGPDAFSPDLPGPSKAVRDGLRRACIGGTIAVRINNGWSQETSAGKPLRCIANSQ